MEFPFRIRSVFPENITIWDTPAILELERNYTLFSSFAQVVDKMGVASAKAQVLNVPITSVNKMLHTDQRLYVHASDTTVDGILKVGRKKLFVSNNFGQLKEIEPLCVLDIYVHESKQRSGIGRKLFDYMLQGVSPEKLAYDRPSEKLIGFLAKHFGLKRYAPQANNFVVFKQYWDETISDKSMLMSISQRPLTKNRRASGTSRAALAGVSPREMASTPQKEQKTPAKVAEPRSSPSKFVEAEPTNYYADSYEQAEDQGAYKIVTLPRSPTKVPGQSTTSFENLFPTQTPPQQPQYKSNLSPLTYKRRDIAEPPNRTTPTKLAAESRGPAITATQRFKHSPIKEKEDPINGVEAKQTTTMRATANRTVDTLPTARDELSDIRRQYDSESSPQKPPRSSQFQRQFYGKRNIF